MAGYTRQSAAQIVTGEVAEASDFNDEFNQIEAAFDESTGHAHDGTSNEGPTIKLLSDADGDTSIEVEQITDEDTIRLTALTVEAATITSTSVTSNVTLDVDGNELILDADGDTSITADTDDQIDIKIAGADDFRFTTGKFEALTGSVIDANGNELILDADGDTSITADTDDQIDIRIAGADDFRFSANSFNVLSGSTLTVGSGATLDVSSGTLTLANNQISGDKVDGGTISNFASTGIDDNSTSTTLTLTSGNAVGVGITSPDGKLHVHSASAGVVAADSLANDIVIENSTSAGMSILTPASFNSNLYFGTPDSNISALVRWSDATDEFVIGTNVTGGSIKFNVGVATTAINITSAADVGIGTDSPDGKLHVHSASAGVITAAGDADDLIVENSGPGGITILTPNGDNGNLYFGNPSDQVGALVRWDEGNKEFSLATHTATGSLRFATGTNSPVMYMTSAADVGIGTDSPDGKLHVHSASAGVVSPDSLGDDIVIESNGSAGMSILTPEASNANIYFGTPGNNVSALVRWTDSTDEFVIGSNVTGAKVRFNVGAGEPSFTLDSTGAAYLGDTSNANSSHGLTINQAGFDDEIFSLKSSDISHGMSSETEVDTFGYMGKVTATTGGLSIRSYGTSARTMELHSHATTETAVKNGTATANIQMRASLKSGTTVGAHGANANLLCVQDDTNTKMILDKEGELHLDGGVAAAFDHYEDVELLRALAVTTSNPKDIVKTAWDDFVRYNENDLIEIGLLGDTIENGGLLNVSQLLRVLTGAVTQQHTRQLALEQENEDLKSIVTDLSTKMLTN